MTKQEVLIDYDVVSETQGHEQNRGIKLVEAAKDIFGKVKEKAMECAVKGEFIQFNTVDELQRKLEVAAKEGFAIRCYDHVVGG